MKIFTTKIFCYRFLDVSLRIYLGFSQDDIEDYQVL